MILEQLKSEITEAQKARNARLLGALRLMLAELNYAQVDYKAGVLPDEEIIKVLAKEAKKRRESIEIYEKAGDKARAEQEIYELALIEKYLPVLMSEEEVASEVEKIAISSGLKGGRLVGEVMKSLRGKAEGGLVLKVVNQNYAG